MKTPSRCPVALALIAGLALSLMALSSFLHPEGAPLNPAHDLVLHLGIAVILGCLGVVWWAAGNWNARSPALCRHRHRPPSLHPGSGEKR